MARGMRSEMRRHGASAQMIAAGRLSGQLICQAGPTAAETCLPRAADELSAVTAEPRPYLVTLASQKGGTGKSTLAMLLAVALLKRGRRVGTLDLDGHQGTFSRYLANRAAAAEASGQVLELPMHRRIASSVHASREHGERDEQARFDLALSELAGCAYAIVDTPGHDCHLARLACTHADAVITPLNDSLLDLDVLARIDARKREVVAPTDYSRTIWDESDRRMAGGRLPIDWIVVRNRLPHLDGRNNREVEALLRQLAHRLGFRLAPGLSERVVFRELFLKGLTLLDLPPEASDGRMGQSRLHAGREVEDLLRTIGVLP